MSQVDFNQNIVNFNQVGGGYDKVDIGNLGNSSIPGLSGSLSGQNEQMDFQLQAGGSDKYGAIKDANFQRHESVTAKGPENKVITLTGDVSGAVAEYERK